MHIAFYAPMKAPSHPSPSGDRRMARLLCSALEAPGHTVTLASDFRSYDGAGSAARQRALQQQGEAEARRLIEAWRESAAAERPDIWFTYHLYHKAPDWLGPAVSEALDIPYVVAEASFARKQMGGPHALGLESSARAIARADAILSFTAEDEAELRPLVKGTAHLQRLAPFVDTAPYQASRERRAVHRSAVGASLGLDDSRPWLLTVAMMRLGDKLASYRLLGRSLYLIADPPWQLVVVGDGEARSFVEEALRSIGEDHVAFAGEQTSEDLLAFYAAADLFVWPAVNEAYGMALLEAASTGLPIVAGRWRGVPEIVADGETGVLIEPWHDAAFAEAVVLLIQDTQRRISMGNAAAARAAERHGLSAARAALNHALVAAKASHDAQYT